MNHTLLSNFDAIIIIIMFVVIIIGDQIMDSKTSAALSTLATNVAAATSALQGLSGATIVSASDSQAIIDGINAAATAVGNIATTIQNILTPATVTVTDPSPVVGTINPSLSVSAPTGGSGTMSATPPSV